MQAYDEFYRIRHLAGFNVAANRARNVNQYMRKYEFSDGSLLRLYRGGKASVATGFGDYKTILVGQIRANAFGDSAHASR